MYIYHSVVYSTLNNIPDNTGIYISVMFMRGSRGGVWTPLKFVRGGVFCGCLMGRTGGPKFVFI